MAYKTTTHTLGKVKFMKDKENTGNYSRLNESKELKGT